VAAPHHLYTGLLVAAFAFSLVWPHYPKTGATGTILGVLIALDDALSHALGIWTPLDWIWEAYLSGVVA
jgi:hypothetical protein